MAVERLFETRELKTSLWKERIRQEGFQTFLKYNRKVDAITLLIIPPGAPTIVHYIDDHVGLLYDPGTKEVVGLRVESFARSFLPCYSDLQKVWKLSDVCQLEDFGDLMIAAQKYEKSEPIIAKQLSQITHSIAEQRGLQLPVPA